MTIATSGTTGAEGGDAGLQPVTGTPTPAGVDGETVEQRLARVEAERARLQAAHEQSLSEKATHEDTAAQLRAAQAQLQAFTASPTGQGGGDDYALLEQQATIDLFQRAKAGEPEAVRQWNQSQRLEQATRELRQELAQTRHETMIARIPDADQQAVKAKIEAKRAQGEYISPQTAQELVNAERLAAGQKGVADREAQLRAAEEARARGVVSTSVVPVAAPTQQRVRMTFSQIAAKLVSLEDNPAAKDTFIAELSKIEQVPD